MAVIGTAAPSWRSVMNHRADHARRPYGLSKMPGHKRSLSSARQRLLEVFQRVRYGFILRLPVRAG
jgi:hypothetical protein